MDEFIPELSDKDSAFIDRAIDRITEKYLAQGGKEADIRAEYMDYVMTMMFYYEGRQAVLQYVRDYTYNPAQFRQPVYIERYANFSDQPEIKVQHKTAASRGVKKTIVCNGVTYNSLSDCANKLGMNTSTLSHYLNGKRQMPQHFVNMGLRYANRA